MNVSSPHKAEVTRFDSYYDSINLDPPDLSFFFYAYFKLQTNIHRLVETDKPLFGLPPG